jgi:hypothetical protein
MAVSWGLSGIQIAAGATNWAALVYGRCNISYYPPVNYHDDPR